MIRRVFWLTVGAVGGIMGYRRVAALGKRLSGQRYSGQRSSRQGVGTRNMTRDAIRATRMTRGVRGIRSFSRDVREGMGQYSARHQRAEGPTLRATDNNDVNVKDDR